VIVITGGSSGIGCSIIKAIRSLKNDLIICNLSRTKPADFFDEYTHHYGVDLTDDCALSDAFLWIDEIIREAPLGKVILINNSGFGDYGRFSDLSREKQLGMLDLNIRAVVDLTARMLPVMLERGGVIACVASTAAFQPTPFLATYGATKAFVLNWTMALNEDLRGTTVRALAVCPGPTRSNFFKAAGFETPPMNSGLNGSLDMTSDEVAERTLIALANGKTMIVAGWKNQLITSLGRLFPIRVVTSVGGSILRRLRLERHKGGDTNE